MSRPHTLVLPNLDADIDYEQKGGLPALVARALKLPAEAVQSCRLLRRSLDARRRKFKYQIAAEVELADPELAARAIASGRAQAPKPPFGKGADAAILKGLAHGLPRTDGPALEHPPVIVGSGPSGLFAAWLLAEHGYAPIVLERGRRVEKRVKDVRRFEQGGDFDAESNILFGEGGAGTFSDGKLTCRTKSPVKPRLLELMVECTAPEDILFQAKAHVGTDRLRAVLVHLRRMLEARGAVFRFEARVEDLILGPEGQLTGLRLADGEVVPAQVALLGIGHSARDTYAMLHERGVAMEFKPFQLGLRAEHPQELVDRFRYGQPADALDLPTAEYAIKTRHKVAGRELFTFCMCPGGTIVPSVSQDGYLCTNGMSRYRRDSGWANSGIVYTLTAEDIGSTHPLAGVHIQEQIEARAYALGGSYAVPAQRIPDFLRGRPSPADALRSTYPLGHVAGDLREVLPGPGAKVMAQGLEQFEAIWKGYASGAGLLVGPEARGSAPVRMLRDAETHESTSTPGLYPMGEGAGYAGGIMSAALDGVRCAQSLIQAYRPAGEA